MTAERFARLSSARRARKGPGRLLLALVGLAGALLLVFALRPRPPAPPQAVRPTPPLRARSTPLPSPTPAPAPSPTPAPVSRRSDWFELAQPAATETPLPSPPPEPPLQVPAGSEQEPGSCVEASWTAQQGLGRLGEVLVEIELLNRCGRDLDQLEVWFRVTGYRDGSEVQSVCGHPFETVYSGGRARVAIGLPGSLDWYDRVEVEYTGEACR